MAIEPSNSPGPSRRALRLAVLGDFPEENWPSMDLVEEMLLAEIARNHSREIVATPVCPKYRRYFTPVPIIGGSGLARSVDRLLNRFRVYPKHLRKVRGGFDLFHVCDHSYAQLVHELPPDRTGVFCHDLDTFGCLLEPSRYQRPRWFKAMTRRVLSGLSKAAVVFHSTAEMRRQIEHFGLVDPKRLVQAPLGVNCEFTSDPSRPLNVTRASCPCEVLSTGKMPVSPGEVSADLKTAAGSELAQCLSNEFVLHVGSCIPRKRIDVLLSAFTQLRSRRPALRLVQVGGTWTDTQRAQIARLGIESGIVRLPHQTRAAIAELYRRARVVLVTSDAEGFGLPVIEALACGAVVVASDIPTLREAGGNAALYAPVGDAGAFAALVDRVMNDPSATIPPREQRLAHAARFTWDDHADQIVRAYLALSK